MYLFIRVNSRRVYLLEASLSVCESAAMAVTV